MIYDILVILSILICSIVAHEFGHLFYFRIFLKKKVNLYFRDLKNTRFTIRVGTQMDYMGYHYYHNIGIAMSGIVCGFVPLLIGCFYHEVFYLILFFYFVPGCIPDFILIRNNLHKRKLYI